jgi:nucleoside-diphosphate-sugar epimerase
MILVTGGAGYVGSVLVPELLARGRQVTVLDSFLFGRRSLDAVAHHPGLRLVDADLRDGSAVREVLRGGFDAVIHLAAISNDPSSELDPELTRAVNRDALAVLFEQAKAAGVRRLLYASSASVYGIKEEREVTEDLPLAPLTLYARYKAEGEEILNALADDRFCGVSVRAATVCGFSPRLRLDLTINILTEHALTRGEIRVFGGDQERPNVHVRDLADFYVRLLEAPAELVNGQAFNVIRENSTVMDLARLVRGEIDPELPIRTVPTDDRRSYRLSGEKVARRLGYRPALPLSAAVRELAAAFADGRVADPADPIYRNVEWLKRTGRRMAAQQEEIQTGQDGADAQ